MNDERLSEELARRVLGWRATPDRYLTQNRCWLPKWRFDPSNRLDHSFKVLDAAAPTQYTISFRGGYFHVQVEIEGRVGKAKERLKTRAIVLALARSLNLGGA